MDKLKPCRACGAPCHVEHFEGSYGEVDIWVCSKNKLFGGNCPNETAYLYEHSWSTRKAEHD